MGYHQHYSLLGGRCERDLVDLLKNKVPVSGAERGDSRGSLVLAGQLPDTRLRDVGSCVRCPFESFVM